MLWLENRLKRHSESLNCPGLGPLGSESRTWSEWRNQEQFGSTAGRTVSMYSPSTVERIRSDHCEDFSEPTLYQVKSQITVETNIWLQRCRLRNWTETVQTAEETSLTSFKRLQNEVKHNWEPPRRTWESRTFETRLETRERELKLVFNYSPTSLKLVFN